MIVIIDENIQSKVRRRKARQAAAAARPKKEVLLTVEPSVNSDDGAIQVCMHCKETLLIYTSLSSSLADNYIQFICLCHVGCICV